MSFYEDDVPALTRGDFAVDARWNGKAIRLIFDNEYIAQQMLGDNIGMRQPEAGVASKDVEGIADGNPLIIGSVTYTVRVPEPDGTGFTRVRLSKD